MDTADDRRVVKTAQRWSKVISGVYDDANDDDDDHHHHHHNRHHRHRHHHRHHRLHHRHRHVFMRARRRAISSNFIRILRIFTSCFLIFITTIQNFFASLVISTYAPQFLLLFLLISIIS